ncbi:MAG: polysaccharide biosynthesis C-terminal domain-containing protein, partial [Paludibacteraceae bacterium]|nr:polysaccharide biosynthesis C-terminal domain-containing protein [Paludibacteraceae bacterium]
ILRYIIREDYWGGLVVVPVVLLAYIFQGVYFNLSFWYKLNDKTRYGAYMSIIGFIINVALIVLLVPMIGSMGADVASLVAFFTMMIVSYVWGQKYLPIEYDFKSIGLYTLLAAALYGLSRLSEFLLAKYCGINNMWVSMGVNTVLLVVYMVYLIRHDLPLSAIIRRRK